MATSIQWVPIEEVRGSPDREKLRSEVVARAWTQLDSGWDLTKMPPLKVIEEGTGEGKIIYWVLDGHHRLSAAHRREFKQVPVINALAMSRGQISAYGRAVQKYRKLISHPVQRGQRALLRRLRG